MVSAHAPVLRSGRAMRTYGIARALARGGGELDFVFVRFGGDGPDASFSTIPGVRYHEVIPGRGLGRLRAYAGARLRGVPDVWARGASRELASAAERVSRGREGRVIADGPTEAAALAGLASRRRVIYNAHNVESAFRGRFDASLGDPERVRRFERDVLARSAESWVVSDADATAARELCPDATLRVVPNVVDVQAVEPSPVDLGARRALFIGSFSYEPNRIGLRFLIDEVAPRLWRIEPDARLRIVGGGLDASPSEDPRIEWLGFVDRIESAYAGVSCVAVPLLVGGGSPIKFVEAMAHAMPIVATARACAGLSVRAGEHCLIADDADAFATALAALMRGEQPDLGARARRLAAEEYSIEAITERLRA